MRVFLPCFLLAVGSYALTVPSFPDTSIAEATNNVEKRDHEIRQAGYWFEDIPKRGVAAFNTKTGPDAYKVFRNVRDYGARGDGVTDDSDAINRAIQDQETCEFWTCDSSTVEPTVIYFPSGTYMIGKSIDMHYMTQLHGNPNDRPVLKATSGLQALGVIDASRYSPEDGSPGWISTNLFMRQIRNFVVDLTAISAETAATGIHWPASQATSIQNVKIIMNVSPNSKQQGLFIENGSGGYLVDVETIGGEYGFNVGNQQYTMRNVRISKAKTGISMIWNWGWLYQGITISDCDTAISMISNTEGTLEVGSVVIIDSDIINCPTFVDSAWTFDSVPTAGGQLILENIDLNNVGVAVKGPNSATVLPGGTMKIAAWGQGNSYTPDGPSKFQGPINPARRPQALLDGDRYWAKAKPQYERNPLSDFLSARAEGCTGDGKTDDTGAVQAAIIKAVVTGKILFFDHGTYRVTNTIYVPPGARMVGETFSVIMGSGYGGNWQDWNNPTPIIQIGIPGESGNIEWSDMIISTQGPTPGAKVIEYNLNTARGSGIWDVHTRIGGAAGTDLQTTQCPVYTTKPECFVAHTNVHVTESATGAYFENNWFWVGDHDMDDVIDNSTRISIYAGRGLLVEASNVALWANGAEHHTLYQYQFHGAKDVFAGFIQSETPYMQPNPGAKTQPYPVDFDTYKDPDYNTICPPGDTCSALGLRIVDSQGIHIYGSGTYSFFIDYDVSCSSPDLPGEERRCQNRMFSLEGNSSDIVIYSLGQVGAAQMVTIDGVDKASASDNVNKYSNTIGLFQYRV